MQLVQMPLLQDWHLSGQTIQAELVKESPFAQEVHYVMFVAVQLEQVDAHPLQVPFPTTNPRLQTVHTEELVQVMQFRGQLALQELPVRVLPGGQVVQVVGDPTHVTQLLSQAIQVEELDKKAP